MFLRIFADKEVFDYQNQMQPQFCKSWKKILPLAAFHRIKQDWFRTDSNKTKSLLPAGTAPSYKASNQESTSSCLVSCELMTKHNDTRLFSLHKCLLYTLPTSLLGQLLYSKEFWNLSLAYYIYSIHILHQKNPDKICKEYIRKSTTELKKDDLFSTVK